MWLEVFYEILPAILHVETLIGGALTFRVLEQYLKFELRWMHEEIITDNKSLQSMILKTKDSTLDKKQNENQSEGAQLVT